MSGRAPDVLLIILFGLALMGCPASQPMPTPTGSTCPPDSTLTYENFGQAFMAGYCTRCHSSDLHAADRHGAPLYHDFDTLLGIIAVAEHVDEYSAAGPDAVNEIMPPDGDKPTMAERTQLGEWLACEVEKINAPPDAGVGADAGP